MLPYLMKFLSVCMQTAAIDIICRGISSKRVDLGYRIGIYGITIALRTLLISLYDSIALSVSLGFIHFLIISFLYTYPVIKKVYISAMLCILAVLVEMCISLITGVIVRLSAEEVMDNTFLFVIGSIISQGIIIALACLIRPLLKPSSVKMSWEIYLALGLLPIAILVIIYAVTDLMYASMNIGLNIAMIIAIVFIIITIFIVLLMADRNMRQVVNAAQQKIQVSELERQTKYYNDLVEKYKIDNKRLHDIDKQFLVLQNMLKDGNIALREELDKVGDNIGEARGIGYTGISSIDALLNNEASKLKDGGITLEQHIFIDSLPTYMEMDFCLILGNLLDNAVEECLRIDKKDGVEITCDIRQYDDMYSIVVTNTKAGTVAIDKTSKEDKYHHGYGREIVADLVSKYNGNFTIDVTTDKYTAMVMMFVSQI